MESEPITTKVVRFESRIGTDYKIIYRGKDKIIYRGKDKTIYRGKDKIIYRGKDKVLNAIFNNISAIFRTSRWLYKCL
jgi:uncharacterized protein with PhoU and TrkA domain